MASGFKDEKVGRSGLHDSLELLILLQTDLSN